MPTVEYHRRSVLIAPALAFHVQPFYAWEAMSVLANGVIFSEWNDRLAFAWLMVFGHHSARQSAEILCESEGSLAEICLLTVSSERARQIILDEWTPVGLRDYALKQALIAKAPPQFSFSSSRKM